MPHAHYEYGPFGEAIRATGPASRLNPFRWSTKFTDEENALVYYGYRYYSPALGRWISQDPVGESDGNNLYAALINNPLTRADPFGLWTFGFGIQGMFEFIGAMGISLGVYVGRDSNTGKWSFGVLFGPMAGAGGPASLGAGIFAQLTSADSVHELKGLGFELGGSVGGDPVSIGCDFVAGIGPGGFSYAGGEFSLSASLGLLVTVHALVTYTAGWDTDGGWQ
jgi:RHS repeat-associated protein